jgi:hypothetical protein
VKLNGKRMSSVVKRAADMLSPVSLSLPWKKKAFIAPVNNPPAGGPYYQNIIPGTRAPVPAVPTVPTVLTVPADIQTVILEIKTENPNGPEGFEGNGPITRSIPSESKHVPVIAPAAAEIVPPAPPAANPGPPANRRSAPRNKRIDHGAYGFVDSGEAAFNSSSTGATLQPHSMPPSSVQMTVKQGMKDFPAETITAIETELA